MDVDVDINLRQKMDQKENELKRRTNQQVISKNLNYSNDIMLLNDDHHTEDESSSASFGRAMDNNTKKLKYKYTEN